MKLEILAIIPARAGSKRLPNKNIALVAGKPLLCYTVDVALGAALVDRVVVSTDSLEIAAIAKECGAEVPVLRPTRLAQDNSHLPDACVHMLGWLSEQEDYHPDLVAILTSTSPLRTSEDIDAVLQMAQEKDADAVISVCATEHRSSGAEISLGPDGRAIELIWRRVLYQGTCPPVYNPGGGISVIRPEVLKETRTVFPTGFFAHIIPIEHSLDIDLPWHLYLAELILNDIS